MPDAGGTYHLPRKVGLARGLLRDEHLAADVAQDALLVDLDKGNPSAASRRFLSSSPIKESRPSLAKGVRRSTWLGWLDSS